MFAHLQTCRCIALDDDEDDDDNDDDDDDDDDDDNDDNVDDDKVRCHDGERKGNF